MNARADGRGLPARRAALRAIARVEAADAYATLAVPEAVDELTDARERAFASHLAYETIRWTGTLDWMLDQVLSRPRGDVEPAILRVLRLGMLQLFRSNVPARAAVDTSVALAREAVPRKRADGAAGFVNGVLRAASRRLPELPWPDPSDDPSGSLALRTAHPVWIVDELLDRAAPPEDVESLLLADNDPPGVTLRATIDRQQVIDELVRGGIDATAGQLAPEAVRAPGVDPRRHPVVTAGKAVAQDEASMVVAHLVGARSGDRVLDLCAGPGGKATHLAALVGPEGAVTAVELHEHRAELIRRAAHRLGLTIDVRVGDGREPPVGQDPFDAVLLDAPCTGLGTGRRRPDVRWRRGQDDIEPLARLQGELLAAAAARVRPGGRLTYAACTWTVAETVGVTQGFEAAAGRGFELLERRQLRPDHDGTDGMFVAAYRRRG